MKNKKIIFGAILACLMLISADNYAQLQVKNYTCHSMFMVVQWGRGPGCSPSGAASGVVAANSTATLTGAPAAGESVTYVYATLNVYSCTLNQAAWLDCAGWEQIGSSTCCVTEWQAGFDPTSAWVY